MSNNFTGLVSSNTHSDITTHQDFELVKDSLFPEHYTDKIFRSISFVNFNDCTVSVSINGKVSTVKLLEYVGLSLEDVRIDSFIIHELGVNYYFLGTL